MIAGVKDIVLFVNVLTLFLKFPAGVVQEILFGCFNLLMCHKCLYGVLSEQMNWETWRLLKLIAHLIKEASCIIRRQFTEKVEGRSFDLCLMFYVRGLCQFYFQFSVFPLVTYERDYIACQFLKYVRVCIKLNHSHASTKSKVLI